jgi:hypothetical protein
MSVPRLNNRSRIKNANSNLRISAAKKAFALAA